MDLIYKFEIPIRDDIMQLCRVSNNLYNQALYVLRQKYMEDESFIRYEDMDKLMRAKPNLEGDYNYRMLPSQTSQQILRVVDKTIKGFKKAKEDYKKHPEKYKGEPALPRYRKRGGMFNLYFTKQRVEINNGVLVLCKGGTLLKNTIDIKVPQYEKYTDRLESIRMVRIIPQRKTFRVEIVYRTEDKHVDVDVNKYASIDPGVGNLCTMFCEEGTFIYDGKFLKSYNRFYNKTIARLRSIKDKQGIDYETKRLLALHDKRNRYFDDAFHKISRVC